MVAGLHRGDPDLTPRSTAALFQRFNEAGCKGNATGFMRGQMSRVCTGISRCRGNVGPNETRMASEHSIQKFFREKPNWSLRQPASVCSCRQC